MKKATCLLILFALISAAAGCSGSDQGRRGEDVSGDQIVKETAAERVTQDSEADSVEEDSTQGTRQETEAGALAGSGKDMAAISYTMYFVDPESSPYVEGGKKIAQLVQDATDGRIRIDVVGGSEAGERELVEQAMDQKLDIVTCANSVLTNYIPQMNILDQAYLWENEDQAHAAVDGKLGEMIRERAERLGLHVIGFEESGFRNTFTMIPVEQVEDFSKITIRTMENKYHKAAFEAFGAEPIGMPYPQVLDALKDGSINACENATVNCLNSGYYEYTRHVTNTRHAFVYILLLMSDEAWERIPEELRDTFLDAVQEGVEWERGKLAQESMQVVKELEDLGVTFHEIDTAALKKLYQEAVKEKGFVFDPEWEAAVEEAIREAG
jgi:TRAP-type C4-dicarboxylate transport system substrate-binding protein